MCPLCTVTAWKLMEESAINAPPDYQTENVWLKASVLYEQLLSTLFHTHIMFMFFVFGTIHQLFWSKIDFLLQI